MSQPSASQRERRILLIEDDRTLATELRGMLAGHGYVVDHAADGVAGYGLASTGQFSVMIVDRMLPGIDGLTLVKRLRDAGVATPVLFLTAVSRVEERVRGLMAGGDDYLVKPFDTAELVARLDVIQRRNVPAASVVELGPLRLDLLERKASRNGRDLELMPHEFRLLAYLVAHAGVVVSKETLLVEVWNYKFIPDSNVVSVHISNLRHKLEERGAEALIYTVRGLGFVLHVPG